MNARTPLATPTQLVAFVTTCILAIGLLGCAAAELARPPATRMQAMDARADLDADGASDYLRLAGGKLDVYDAGGRRYQSPRAWTVESAAIEDLDADGVPELALIVWNRRVFGTSHPFWVEGEPGKPALHVYVMRYAGGALKPVWMSSALGQDAADVRFADGGRVLITDARGEMSTWIWKRWGYESADDPQPAQVDAAEAGEARNGGNANGAGGTGGGSQGAGPVTFAAVGDNLMHLGICAQAYDAATGRYDFSPVYAPVAGAIAGYDLAAVCQETILVNERAAIGDFPDFGTPTEVGDALHDAGFDIIASATNHAFDRGMGGLEDTLAFWESYPDIALLGLHNDPAEAFAPATVQANGMTFALFNATYGLNGHALAPGQEWRIDTLDDADRLVAGIERAESDADATVCFLHIGEEYADGPTAEQRQMAERAIAAGADLVICSHPHVVQPVERLTVENGNGGVVFWSLGNFVAHQVDVRTIVGGMANATFQRGDDGKAFVASYGFVPTVCHFTADATAVYFLDAYTDELAAEHSLNAAGRTLSPALLRTLWDAETNQGGR